MLRVSKVPKVPKVLKDPKDLRQFTVIRVKIKSNDKGHDN